MLSDIQVQRAWLQLDVRVEAGLVCSFGTHHRVLRAMQLAKVTKGVCGGREEATLKNLAAYQCDYRSQSDVS